MFWLDDDSDKKNGVQAFFVFYCTEDEKECVALMTGSATLHCSDDDTSCKELPFCGVTQIIGYVMDENYLRFLKM